ncbi:MAG: glutathione S-transferase family protein [Marinosulfonomonas sp.]|nr:glutathione S-transferase family protein [Marinosulfonomonas sp.]
MIRLHHYPETRSMRSLWLLNELGVDFEVVVQPFDKSMRSPEFLALNPVGRVPALELDGQVIWESGAITEVLCEVFPDAGLGRTVGGAERADWLIWVNFAETISQHSAALTQQHVALYDDSMRSPVIMKLEAKRLEKCFGAIEERLRGRDYLLSQFSAADISVGQAVYMSRHFARIEPFPALSAWYARITERPGFVASLPPEGADSLYAQDFYAPWPI